MTTATLAVGNRTMDTETARPRRSLEEMVDRLFEAMGFGAEMETAEQGAARTIHEARRLRQVGDLDAALAMFEDIDMAKATPTEARWAFSEWKQIVTRRFRDRDVKLYSQAAGRAAALVPNGDGETLEVVAVLGMRWRPGKVVSGRSLRGLRPPHQVRGRLWGRLAPDPAPVALPGDVGAAVLAAPARTRRPLAPACLGRVRRQPAVPSSRLPTCYHGGA